MLIGVLLNMVDLFILEFDGSMVVYDGKVVGEIIV